LQKICFIVESGGGGGGGVGGGDRNNKTFATSDRARLREKPPPACFAPAWLVTITRPAEHVRNPLTAARCGLSPHSPSRSRRVPCGRASSEKFHV